MAQLLDRSGARGRFRPSPVVPLPEQIRRQLVEAGAMGDLRPGDRLPGEATLASQFGASAAEVRAGLNALMAMGLVEIVRGRNGGVRIAQPKPDLLQQTLHDGLSVLADLSGVSMENLAEARRESETSCARAASRRRTEDDLRAMRDALDRSDVHAQHTAIYQAIADCKPQAAARAVQRHVAYLEARYARLGLVSRSA